jgi:spore coat protein H
MGSFRPLHEKPSLSLKFDEYVEDQKFFGLSKIMLNNSSQDPTYLAELVSMSLFRDAACPRRA